MIPDEIQAVSCCNISLPLLEIYYTIILRLGFPFLQLQSVILSVIKINQVKNQMCMENRKYLLYHNFWFYIVTSLLLSVVKVKSSLPFLLV